MRSSDWSSDVCSSDLSGSKRCRKLAGDPSLSVVLSVKERLLPSSVALWQGNKAAIGHDCREKRGRGTMADGVNAPVPNAIHLDRKGVVEGKSVSVRVDLGVRRMLKKKHNKDTK